MILLIPAVIAALATPPSVSARSRKFDALVFTDRERPDQFVFVGDLSVNDTIVNEDGDRFFVLQTPDGTFQLPFESVAEVEFTKYMDVVLGDTIRYEARVVLPSHGVRRGTIELRVLRGFVNNARWHDLLAAQRDRGASLYRILFVAP